MCIYKILWRIVGLLSILIRLSFVGLGHNDTIINCLCVDICTRNLQMIAQVLRLHQRYGEREKGDG